MVKFEGYILALKQQTVIWDGSITDITKVFFIIDYKHFFKAMRKS